MVMVNFVEFIRVLSENPQIIDDDESVVDPGIRSMSPDALKRSFKKIDNIFNIDLYMSEVKGVIVVLGVVKTVNHLGRHELVFDLVMNKTNLVPNGVQVSSVWVKSGQRERSIAKSAYLKLIDLGYIVISDKVQLVGGALLWNSLIKNSRKYKVRALNVRTKEFITVDGESILNIDTINYDSIWKSTGDGKDIVLIMSKVL